jgi:hypothetical protein
MRQYDYLLFGLQRTGTTSLWETLKFNPKITTSKIKETSVDYIHDSPPNDFLLSNFKPNKNTKIFLDGTPNQFINHKFLKKIEQETNIKCIFTLRNPISRIYSVVIYQSIRYLRQKKNLNKDFINGNKILKNELEELIFDNFFNFDVLKEAKKIFKENILILKIEDLKKSTNIICNFLDIERIKSISNLNSSKDGYFPFEMISIKRSLKKLFLHLKDDLFEMMEIDNKKLKNEFGISFNESDIPNFLRE